MDMNYELRPALWEDNPFLAELYADVHATEFASLNLPSGDLAQLLALRFKAQRMSYAVEFPEGDHSIVWAGAYRIGRILLDDIDSEIKLIDIALLSPFRGEGVGTSILEQVQAYARERGLPLRLSIGPQNPAKRLFERLGFTVTRSTEETSSAMEWIPEPAGD